jgi:hypothetical protein
MALLMCISGKEYREREMGRKESERIESEEVEFISLQK